MSSRAGTRAVKDLVYTTHFVDVETVSVREVRTWFHAQPGMRSLGVIDKSKSGIDALGLVTRERLNQRLLEGCSSDAKLKDLPELLAPPFCAEASSPISDALKALLDLRGNEETFFDDIVVHVSGRFVGLASVKDLVVDQLGDFLHRLSAMEAQQAALTKQNKELFENSFRQSRREAQFATFFDRSPVPIAVFNRDGRLITASRRFFRFSNYSHKQVDASFNFNRLFADSWEDTRQAEESASATCKLTLLPFEQPPVNVETLVEASPELDHVIVSVLGFAEKGLLAAPEIIESTASRSASRITQAIKTRLEEGKAKGLARSVANNLIDREDEVDRLMRKLDKIFEVSERVEKIQPELAENPHPAETETQHLKGDLSEFSVIDLCQILIQGTKTGELTLHPVNGDAPKIYFYCGEIVHAEHGGIKGAEALVPILKLREGKFDFIFNRSNPEVTISGDSMGLLMEACRKMDEAG